VVKILQVKNSTNFNGYTNKEDSEKKVATNLFEEGQSISLSGTLSPRFPFLCHQPNLSQRGPLVSLWRFDEDGSAWFYLLC